MEKVLSWLSRWVPKDLKDLAERVVTVSGIAALTVYEGSGGHVSLRTLTAAAFAAACSVLKNAVKAYLATRPH